MKVTSRCPSRRPWPLARGAWLLLAPLALPVALPMLRSPVLARPGPIDEKAVEAHVESLETELLRRQLADGSWDGGEYDTGLTALVLLALKQAGLPVEHPALREGVRFIVANSDDRVYSESLVLCALEELAPETQRARMRDASLFLRRAQNSRGAWGYGRDRSAHDNSNSQFAVLGLAAAERNGIEVPQITKKRAADHWIRSQLPDGGWGYQPDRRSEPYLAMTCAGIASLHLMGREYERPDASCGQYVYDRALRRGLEAMVSQMGRESVRQNEGWAAYALYALERVGMFLDLKEIGGVDWYRWGAIQILDSAGPGTTPDLAFHLLFLARGEAQVGIAKWQWNGDWNNDHRDAGNWTELASEELELKLDWIPARLDRADSPAAKASLIFVSGHQRFSGTDEEALFLRRFLARNGTVVAEGCCGSRVFVESFEDFVQDRLYPDVTVEFSKIRSNHPVCLQRHALSAEEIGALEVKTGCHHHRILILERDISCALNGEQVTEAGRLRSQKVAVNLLQWAMRARLPRGKLARIRLADQEGADGRNGAPDAALPDAAALDDEEEIERIARYRQPFGRLIHRGDWDVDAGLFPTLQRALHDQAWAPRFDGEIFVDPRSKTLFACPVLFVTGHGDPRLKPAEWAPLRTYVQNGGVIAATACCGREDFDRGFRRLLGEVFPNDRLETIPPDDSVWQFPFSARSLKLHASREYRKRYGARFAPLEGLRRDGRWVVLYSPADLCCDLEGDLDEGTVAYKKESSLPLWVNMLHYCLTP